MEQQPKLNISLDKTTKICCDKCKNEVFQDGILLRKASRFLTGTQQDALIPIPVFTCSKCGHVNNEFLPMQLRIDETEIIEETNNGKAKLVSFNSSTINNNEKGTA